MSLKKLISLRNTLSFRLTLWYAGIFTVSSFVAFLLFYTLIASVFRERTDRELLGQVNRFSTLLAVEGVEALKNAAMIESQAAGVRKVFFRFLSQNGEVFSSSNMSYWQDIGIHSKSHRGVTPGQPVCFRNRRHFGSEGGSANPLFDDQSPHHYAGGRGHGELFPISRRI